MTEPRCQVFIKVLHAIVDGKQNCEKQTKIATTDFDIYMILQLHYDFHLFNKIRRIFA